MSRDYEQTARELLSAHPVSGAVVTLEPAIAAALRAERLATLREAREAVSMEYELSSRPAAYERNQVLAGVLEVLDRLIADAEKESETDG